MLKKEKQEEEGKCKWFNCLICDVSEGNQVSETLRVKLKDDMWR